MLSIRNVTYILPDGRLLLNDLTESFDGEPAALVGRNGVGKTVLAKLLAGLLSPSSGTVVRGGRVFYLDQLIAPSAEKTVADLLGLKSVLEAVRRIEQGRGGDADFEAAEGNWDLEERVRRELGLAGLAHIEPDFPATGLSGGECTRAALVGAFVSGADFLILDEPTNHLDANSKEILLNYLATWKRGLLTVSHDRVLLGRMKRIVELSSSGLRSYGGNYMFYEQCRQTERRAALENLEYIKTERKRTRAEHSVKLERQQHRAAQGRKSGATGGMPKLLLNAMKDSSDKTTGKLKTQGDEKQALLAASEYEAFLKAGIEAPIVLIPPECAVPASKIVVRLEEVRPPWGCVENPVSFTLNGPERVAITGPNGCGKTTLLRLIAGRLKPLSGCVGTNVPSAYLDQFASLNDALSSVENLKAEASGLSPAEAGTRLAQIGLAGERRHFPASVLSGGERLKLALLCALSRIPSPQLLLLDEPTNHLDLDSVLSVEKLLNAYTGAMIVVSHDPHFLGNIGIVRQLALGAGNASHRVAPFSADGSL